MTDFHIITRDDCAFCEKAKAMMFDNGDSYHEQKIGQDITRDEVLEKYPSRKVLPIIMKEGEIVGGLTELLDYYNELKHANNHVSKMLQEAPKGVKIRFTKKDGTERVMIATLNGNLIPEEDHPKNPSRHPEGVQVVYDLEKSSWRSFRKDSLISYGEINGD